MNRSSVAVIVLNWNNPDDTLCCLASLAQVTYPRCQVIVVDNGSTDDSVARIRSAYPDMTLIETGANLGYAGGNNVGIRHALARGADFVCILNNDVTVAPDFLEPLAAASLSVSPPAITTPMICEADHPDTIWVLGADVDGRTASPIRLHAGEPRSAWAEAAPFPVDFAPGTAMLVPRVVYEAVGLMDEAFFLYFEEMDWGMHVRQRGYTTLAVPASVVWHKVSATLGTTSPIVDYYMLRNHLRLISRHWSGPSRWARLTRAVLDDLSAILAFTVKSHRGARTPHRNARLLALRDAALHRWGEMGPEAKRVCQT